MAKIKHRISVIQANRKLHKYFPDTKLTAVKSSNRHSLAMIDQWIQPTTLANSVFNYGIMPEMEERINCTIDNHTTYTDILGYLTTKLRKPVQYFEMGVSVGKNFWQMANFLEHATLVGFDIELFNTTIESQLVMNKATEWPSRSTLRKFPNKLSSYTYSTNTIDYVSADEFDETAWQQLAGRKFNVYFSDALHDPAALLHEFAMLQQFQLIDEEEFILMWDDLGGSMTEAFLTIEQQLKKKHPRLFSERFTTNGWMNYKNHHIGIITNIHF